MKFDFTQRDVVKIQLRFLGWRDDVVTFFNAKSPIIGHEIIIISIEVASNRVYTHAASMSVAKMFESQCEILVVVSAIK